MATRQSRVFLLAVLFGIAGMASIAVARIYTNPLSYYIERAMQIADKYHAVKSLPASSPETQEHPEEEVIELFGANVDEWSDNKLLIGLYSLLAFVFGCISLKLTITGWNKEYHWKYIFSIIPLSISMSWGNELLGAMVLLGCTCIFIKHRIVSSSEALAK